MTTVAELAELASVAPAPDWTEALCAQADPEAWFPVKGGSTRNAKRVCARCPIIAECRAWALATNQRYGVWGGLSESERRTLRRRQLAANGHTTGSGRVAAAPAPSIHTTKEGDR